MNLQTIGFILLIFLFSCEKEKSRMDNPLLNGNEYKLWYILNSENANPEFLYIDCYETFYTLGFNYETGRFVQFSDSISLLFNLSGKWKYNSDSTIYLNNILHTIKIGCDTFTYQSHEIWDAALPEPVYYDEYYKLIFLQNETTNAIIKLRDTGLPINLYTYFYKEKDLEHYEEWGKRIKKSPILDEKDYMLWHFGNEEKTNSFMYSYYDKYGKYGYTYLNEHTWSFSNPYDSELIFAGNWYQYKDTFFQIPFLPKLVKNKKTNDTLKGYNIKDGTEWILIDPNITPKK